MKFTILNLFFCSIFLNAMYEAPGKKMWRGVKSENIAVMQEAYDDFVCCVSNEACSKRFLDHNYYDYVYKTNYLLYAVDHESFEVVKKLLELKADIEYKNRYGDTAFIYAVKKENVEIIKLLLNAGADIDATNNSEGTALRIDPAYYGDLEIAQLLVNYGASITKTIKNGKSPIDIARQRGHSELAKFLEEQLKIKHDLITKEASEYFPKGVDKMIAEYVD